MLRHTLRFCFPTVRSISVPPLYVSIVPCRWAATQSEKKGKEGTQEEQVKDRAYFQRKIKEQQVILTRKKAQNKNQKQKDYAKKLAEKFPEISALEEERKQRKELAARGEMKKSLWQQFKYQVVHGNSSKILLLLILCSIPVSIAVKTKKGLRKREEEFNINQAVHEKRIEELEKKISFAIVDTVAST